MSVLGSVIPLFFEFLMIAVGSKAITSRYSLFLL